MRGLLPAILRTLCRKSRISSKIQSVGPFAFSLQLMSEIIIGHDGKNRETVAVKDLTCEKNSVSPSSKRR